jgi:PAS domain S-box-containing protein
MADKESILIVDDDESARRTLALIFGKKGYETETVGTGREALEKARGRFFNVALLDIRLPDVEGVELLTPLKEMHPDMGLMMITGYASIKTAVQALNAGASAYITKPVDMDEMLAKLRDILERQRLVAEKRQAEGALQESQHSLQAVVETAPSLIVLTDPDGRITLFNRACEELTGYRREEVLGKTIPELFLPPEWVPAVQKHFVDPYAPEVRAPHENPWLTKSGAERLIEWRCTVLPSPQDGRPCVLSTGIDITERKQAEEALRESEEKYRYLVERANDGITIIQDSIVQYANPRVAEMWGGSVEEVIGTRFTDYIDPDELPKVAELYRRRVAGESVAPTYETVARRRNGEKVYVELNAGVITYQGRPADLVIVRDITERKRAEEALRESEQRYRQLFEGIGDAVMVCNSQGRFVDCNEATLKRLGYSREDLVRLGAADIVHPDFHQLMKDNQERIWAGATTVVESAHRCKDGRVIPVEVNARRIEYQGKPAILAVVRDITERVRAEEALQETNAYLENLFNYANAPIIVWDPQFHITRFNHAFEALTGRRADEVIGKSLEILFPPTLVASSMELIKKTLRGERWEVVEINILHRDGSVRTVLWNSATIFALDGTTPVATIAQGQDITERKRAEEALAHERDLLHTLMDNLPDAIYFKDADGRFTRINKAQAERFGLSDPAQAVDKTDFDFFTAGHAQPAYDDEQEIIRSGQPLVGKEEKETWPDGRQTWVSTTKLPLRDNQGHMIGTFGVSRDITERKRAEEEIHRRNRELGVLNQIIAASATSAEPEAILEVACRELAEAFGMPQATAALLNEKKTEAVVVAEHFSAASEQRVTQEPLTAVGQAIPVEGNPVFQYLLSRQRSLMVDDAQNDPRLAPIHDLMRQRGTVSLLILPLIIGSEVVGSLGLEATEPRHFSAEDVNLAWSVADQVAGALARARLARTHQRLITAIEQAAESVVITDTGGTILYVNPAFERVSGYSRAEAVGQHTRTVKPGKQDGSFHQKMQAVLRAGETWQGRLVSKKKDGTLYTEEATISPVRDESGAIVSFVAVMRDVTREVQLEEQYRQAQKMEAVGRLTAGIAHDFNNLLTAINGFAELMQFQLPPDDPLQESLGKILGAGRRAADLVRQLLAFSRKQIMEPQVLDLNAVVSDMDKILRRIIGEDIELKTALAPDLWPVKVDPAQIEQVIVNLAVNARDAMPNGGHLTIETANALLDEDYTARHLDVSPGEYAVLAVSDNGLGMSKEVKTHLFEPFFTTKEAGKGTGLGLATVYGIVEQSGGTIWVYSEAGHGTTFKIYLPRAEGAVAPLTRSDRAGELPRGMETVLLVEDDPAVRDLMARVLRQQGYAVLEAADGQEALRLARQHGGKIHLLLTDVVMPGLSGMALARQLAPLQPGMELLFMSGYADNAVVQHSMLDAGVAFLQKPFSSLALARKVRQVLDAPQRESPKDRRQLEVPP